ncbi:hypothetical protein F5Y18DRAFT_436343 [Xylariaceae sp. FL1019]|nr:hypothetical protein F5Y18DRAFT_436343 [Xylariaceae sp. FL1019]
MTTLLSLPRELRDQIVEDLAWIPLDPPKDTTALLAEDRMPNPVPKTRLWSDTWYADVLRFEKQSAIGKSVRPLMLVNHQLYQETKEALARLAKKPVDYVLDILYSRNAHFYPTWLSVPTFSSNVRTIYTQFRFPNMLDTDVFSNPKGPVSHRTFYPIFHRLLSDLTRFGPRGKATRGRIGKKRKAKKGSKSSSTRHPPVSGDGITIENLIIDFVPTDGPNVLPLWPYVTSDNNLLSALQRDNWKVPPDSSLVAGDVMSDRLIDGLFLWTYKFSHHCQGRNQFLYEVVGNIEIRLNGMLKERFDLGSRFAELTTDPGYGSLFPHEEQLKQFQEWLRTVAQKREAAGLKFTATNVNQIPEEPI